MKLDKERDKLNMKRRKLRDNIVMENREEMNTWIETSGRKKLMVARGRWRPPTKRRRGR